MPKPRSKNNKPVARKMHIYCEGKKTEPNYIGSYISDRFGGRLRDVIVVENAKTNTPVQLVKEALAGKKGGGHPKGDSYWVVFDRESKAKYKDSLHDTAFDLAKANDINIALTNVCFEYWLLLHFVTTNAPYDCFDDLMAQSGLRAEFKKLTGQSYEKGAANIYSVISSRVDDARRRALKINLETLKSAPANVTRPHLLNPYTDMPRLLDAIDSFQ
ncbi:RloB family protein [Pseudomonas sp. LH21]|uniref:RloB family protein n=1 Tax=Pseudomonas sp. LH21 TaxID=3114884 RepID=UPI002F94AEC8